MKINEILVREEKRDKYCSDKCCGSNVKAEDCKCPADCKGCNCNDPNISETATAGATSAGSIASVANPQVAIGKDRFKKSYTGSPGVSGTKAPRLPKVIQPKNPNGTAKGAHALPGVSLFGGPGVVRR